METITSSLQALVSFAKYSKPDDVEEITKVADKIGTMERDEYLAMRKLWKEQYKTLSRHLHDLKPQRKGGTPESEKATFACHQGRDTARAYMLVRHALKEVARRHVTAKNNPAIV